MAESSPDTFLEIRVKRLNLAPALIGLCVGYEGGRWRSRELAKHMMEWLPEFALTYAERKDLRSFNAVSLLRAAARSIYNTEKFKNRGEFGELLLHIGIRQVFNTLPAISKIYYKDSTNDTVKGFDAVHVVAANTSLQLWLGEVKFYKDISRAITDVVEELRKHTEGDYLRHEFAAIVNKIDLTWPHSKRLRKLLHPNTSLDNVFDVVSVPVLLTYDSDVVNSFSGVSAEYKAAFKRELERYHVTFRSKSLPAVRIYLFLVPLKDKTELLGELDQELGKWQVL